MKTIKILAILMTFLFSVFVVSIIKFNTTGDMAYGWTFFVSSIALATTMWIFYLVVDDEITKEPSQKSKEPIWSIKKVCEQCPEYKNPCLGMINEEAWEQCSKVSKIISQKSQESESEDLS